MGPSAVAITEGGRWLRLGQTWEVAAWETVQLGSCPLMGKMLCESTHLYMYPLLPCIQLCHVSTTPACIQLYPVYPGTPSTLINL